MEIEIQNPEPKMDIASNLKRLDIFLQELKLLKSNILSRAEELSSQYKKQDAKEKEIIKAEKLFSLDQLFDENLDIILNLNIKTFFFIYRQAMSKLLTVISQINNSKTGNLTEIKDGGNDGNFNKFFEKLISGVYDQCLPNILLPLKQDRDYFIQSKIIRDNLKKYGTIFVRVINLEKFQILIFINNLNFFELLKNKPLLKKEEIKSTTIELSFFETVIQIIEKYVDLLKNNN